MAEEASMLIKDLSNVPNIVGGLGLSIAAAQKAFNLDYIENIEKLVGLAKGMLGSTEGPTAKQQDKFREFLTEMILSLAPSRYQFTETTITVKMDLAQTMSRSEQGSLGIDMGAIAINGAMASAFGYDYRAAAEVKAVLHASTPGANTFRKLLERATEIGANAVNLPSAATVDKSIISATGRVYKQLTAQEPPAINTPTPPAES
jgi:hypothetical protein